MKINKLFLFAIKGAIVINRIKIKKHLISTFNSIKNTDFKKINTNKSFEDLGLDSLGALEIVFELEKKFNISIPDEKLSNIKSIKDFIDIVEEELNNY